MKECVTRVVAILLLSFGSSAWAAPMDDMDQTMQQIRATEDPAERERLLDEHLEQMHEQTRHMYEQMGQMMEQMNAQRTETKHLHDHRKFK